MADNNDDMMGASEDVIKALERLAAISSRYGGTLTKSVKENVDVLNKLSKGTKEYREAQNKLVTDVKKQYRSLSDEVKQGVKSQQELKTAADELSYAIKHTTDASEKATLQQLKNEALRKAALMEFTDSLSSGLSKSIGTTTSGVSSFVKSLQSGASATELSAGLMNTAIDAASAGAHTMTAGVKAAGTALSGIPLLGPVIQGVTGAASDLADAANEAATKLAKFGVEIASKEVEKTVKSFHDLSQSGALFSSGMTGMRSSARAAGLGIDQFANVVKTNSALLAESGLSVTGGAKEIGRVSQAMQRSGIQKQLLKLGFSFEEQAGLSAEVVASMRKTVGGAARPASEVAAETEKYAQNLRLLSSLTGDDAKAKVEQRKQENTELAFRMKTAQMSDSQRAQLNLAMADMTDMEAKNFRERMVFGTVINREGAIYEATVNGARQQSEEAVALAKNNNLTVKTNAELNAKYGEMAKKGIMAQQGVAMAGMAGKGDVSGVTKAMGEKIDQANSQTKRAVKDAERNNEKQKNAGDKLTNNVIGAEIAAQKLKVALEDLLTPAIEKFADISNQMLAGVAKMMADLGLGKPSSTATNAPGAVNKIEKSIETGVGKMVGGAKDAVSGAMDYVTGDTGVKGLLSRIAEGEGTSDTAAKKHGLASGYDVTLGYGKYAKGSKPLSQMTIAEVKQLQSDMLKGGASSTAVGKYQFISKTLAGLQKKLRVGEQDIFSAELQDKFGKELLKQRGLGQYKSGKISSKKFQDNLASEWASIATSETGKSRYGQATGTSSDQIQAAIGGVKDGLVDDVKTAMTGVEGFGEKLAASGSSILDQAKSKVGKTEENTSQELVGYLNQYSGTTYKSIAGNANAWCARFVNATLGASGIKGNNSASAASFKTYGQGVWDPSKGKDLSGVKSGDIVVVKRNGGSGSHVAFVQGVDQATGKIKTVGGNQGVRGSGGGVTESSVNLADVQAIRRAPGASGPAEPGAVQNVGSYSGGLQPPQGAETVALNAADAQKKKMDKVLNADKGMGAETPMADVVGVLHEIKSAIVAGNRTNKQIATNTA